MKAILMSIKPQHVANILNLIKTLEIRKKFPKDYIGWVYIYCTKNGGLLYKSENDRYLMTCLKGYFPKYCLNGKVVARFWCDKVDDVIYDNIDIETEENNKELTKTCLTKQDFKDYLQGDDGYAIHITKLEIFDKPKEISEFSIKVFPNRKDNLMTRYLTRAPQSWCYVEV